MFPSDPTTASKIVAADLISVRPVNKLETSLIPAGDETDPAQVIIAGLGVMQNVRRGHYELGADAVRPLRVTALLTKLTSAI